MQRRYCNLSKKVHNFYVKQELYRIVKKRSEGFSYSVFNDIAIGYAQMAMRNARYSDEEINEMVHVVYSNFDFYDANEALTFYRNH